MTPNLRGYFLRPQDTWCRWCWNNLGVVSIVPKGQERTCWTHHAGICHECQGLDCPGRFGNPCMTTKGDTA